MSGPGIGHRPVAQVCAVQCRPAADEGGLPRLAAELPRDTGQEPALRGAGGPGGADCRAAPGGGHALPQVFIHSSMAPSAPRCQCDAAQILRAAHALLYRITQGICGYDICLPASCRHRLRLPRPHQGLSCKPEVTSDWAS